MSIAYDEFHPEIIEDYEFINAAPGSTCYPWPVTPYEYLQYAQAEMQVKGQRQCINAIGHAKRAIHAHVDFLLHNCGRCLRKSSFPAKLDRLSQLGIVSPGILRKYNQLRNLMEHEYSAPDANDAEELIEIAHLFLEATRCYTRPLPTWLAFQHLTLPRNCAIHCDWDDELMSISYHYGDLQEDGCCTYSAADNEALWMTWVARILKVIRDNSDPYVRCEEVLARPTT